MNFKISCSQMNHKSLSVLRKKRIEIWNTFTWLSPYYFCWFFDCFLVGVLESTSIRNASHEEALQEALRAMHSLKKPVGIEHRLDKLEQVIHLLLQVQIAMLNCNKPGQNEDVVRQLKVSYFSIRVHYLNTKDGFSASVLFWLIPWKLSFLPRKICHNWVHV